MKHARKDSTHDHVMSLLPTMEPGQMQALLFAAIEHGPESIVEPIEAEFKRRDLSSYDDFPESLAGI